MTFQADSQHVGVGLEQLQNAAKPHGLYQSACCIDENRAAQQVCHVASAIACESQVHAFASLAMHLGIRSHGIHMTGAAGWLRSASLCCTVQAAYYAWQIAPGHLLKTSDAKT